MPPLAPRDPNAIGRWKYFLLQRVLREEEISLEAVTAEVVTENFKLGGHDRAYIYQQRMYSIIPLADLKRDVKESGVKPTYLHKDLSEKGILVQSMTSNLERDKARLNQCLTALLFQCDDADQDVRDMLPDELEHVEFIGGLLDIPRTRSCEEMAQGNRTLIQQQEFFRELCLRQLANRLTRAG